MKAWGWLKLAFAAVAGIFLGIFVKGKRDTKAALENDKEIEGLKNDVLEERRKLLEQEADQEEADAVDSGLLDWVESELAKRRKGSG